MSIETMKQALEALEKVKRRAVVMGSTGDYREGQLDALKEVSEDVKPAITSLRQAIAKLESQEPVAWADMGTRDVDNDAGLSWTTGHFHTTPLYIHPPQRTWQGLTQSDFNEIYDLFANKVSSDFIFEKMYSTIEAKLKERNL